ncbi:MAG: PAS domain S-box protein [Gammaproteobacteria bacterium]|nr:PAS domain S-box protein [Gammaproteobacteria bacterium]
MAVTDLDLFQSHPDPMWVCDDDTLTIRAANAAAFAAYGYSASVFAGMSVHDLEVPAGDGGELDGARQLPMVDTLHRRSDGSVIPVALHVRRFPGTDPAGSLYEARDMSRLVACCRDTSSDAPQREQLMLLETAVARLNDTIMITGADPLDPPGPPIIFVNDAFEKQTGYSAEFALGKSPRLLQGPRTDRAALDRIRTALAEGRPERVSLVNYRSDGTEFHVEFDVAPILGADGRPTHFVSVQRDITERVHAEQALTAARDRLRESEQTFRLVAQTTADVVWDWDLQANTLWRSSGAEGVFGESPNDPAEYLSVWQERIHSDDRERVIDGLYAAIADADEWRDEYRFQRADGGWAHIRNRGSVIRDESGTALRMVGSMIDETVQRDLEEKLQRSQRLDAVGQLTGGVAHDFNNLLTVVLGNADLLTDQLADHPQLQALADMTRSAAERGADLTRRLLAFARRQALDPAATDVNELLSGMYDLLHRTLGEHIHIELHPASNLWQAMVDAPQLESAVLNLCLNARDAMPAGGRLTLETDNIGLADDDHIHAGEIVAGDYVTIAVSDNGSGMPPEVMAHVFEPFFTTKDTGEGSGLGLSMVYGFVKQSAGHVRIDSQPGQGSTITLYLPRAQAAGEQAARRRESASVVGGSERILLVEDDDIVRTFARRQLEELGYAVVSVANGRQALAELESGTPFDLLFTDVVMPGGMNGRELAEQALRLRPGLAVLYTSGYAEDALLRHGAVARGPDGDVAALMLSKPYRRVELSAKVRQALGRR